VRKHDDDSTRKESKYGQKRTSGKMMYGPGCCAHTISADQVRKAKEEARRNGTYRESYHSRIYRDFAYGSAD